MNAFKQALAERRPQFGIWQALANPYCAEICAGAGFDWLLIDAEHAPNDLPLVLQQLQAVAPYPVEPIVRLPVGDPVLVKQYLDIGARTLLVPMVENADKAAAMVAACRYPPRGTRGVGSALGRCSRWNRAADYLQQAEGEIALLLQVENSAGLDNLAAIAATEGVCGVFIGPSDLAASLGHLGDPGHREVQEAIANALGVLAASQVASGILATSDELARRYLDLGAIFVAVATDVTILARGAEQAARRFQRVDHGQAPRSDGTY